MEEKILFVDDDANILEAYERKLQSVLRVRTALGPQQGLQEIAQEGPFAVVVADMHMPLMNGVEFLKRVRAVAPNTVRIMLTGNSDVKVAMDAVNAGNVFRFLTKPCPPKLMGESLVAAIEQYRLITAEKELLEGTLKGVVELLTEVLSWGSPDAFGRALQLRSTARLIAAKMGVENGWEIELAATLSLVGVLAIPSEILAKLTEGLTLTAEEQKALDSVPAIGHELLGRIPRLDNVAEIILHQDKRFDGQGRSDTAIVGDAIPLGSRILKVANDFHQLRAQGKSRTECIAEMQTREGWYDPTVLDALFGVDFSTPAVPTGQRKVLQIPLRELKVGFTLASPILGRQKGKLVGAGTVITEPLLIRLKKYAETSGICEPIEIEVANQ